MVKSVDTTDLKSVALWVCQFESGSRHHSNLVIRFHIFMLLKNTLPQIEQYIQNTLNDWNVPGSTVAIVDQGEVIFKKGFGYSSMNQSSPITDHTYFPIASISKAISAAAISVLVEQGDIQWTSKVCEIFPEFKLYDDLATREFQIIDLFCHRSGLPIESLQQLPSWGYSREQIKRGLAHVKSVASFRTAYAYNNSLYLWVEDIVQKISGKSWADFVKENVLAPLGMTETYVGLKGFDRQESLVVGQIFDETDNKTMKTVQFSQYPSLFLAAGGLVSTIDQLTKWMLANLEYSSLLTPTMWEFLRRPQTVMNPKQFYGLGWRTSYMRPKAVVSHGGLIKGIKHQLWLVPELKCGIAVLTNFTHSEAPEAICEYFADLVMGLPYQNYSQVFFKTRQSIRLQKLPEAISASVDGCLYEGEYENIILGQCRVINEDGQLYIHIGPKPAIAVMEAIGESKFRLRFINNSGEQVGEGHWGTAHFDSDVCVLQGYDRFDNETFVLERLHTA